MGSGGSGRGMTTAAKNGLPRLLPIGSTRVYFFESLVYAKCSVQLLLRIEHTRASSTSSSTCRLLLFPPWVSAVWVDSDTCACVPCMCMWGLLCFLSVCYIPPPPRIWGGGEDLESLFPSDRLSVFSSFCVSDRVRSVSPEPLNHNILIIFFFFYQTWY